MIKVGNVILDKCQPMAYIRPMIEKLISIIELNEFSNFAKKHLSIEEHNYIINYIAANPEKGDIIQGSGGLRKLRFAIKNKGKSGGIRVIFFYHNDDMPVFLITAFLKSDMANISKASCNEFKKMTELIVKAYESKGKS